MSSLFRKIILFFVVSIVAIFVSVISILWIYANKLPDYKFLKNYKPSVSSKLYSGGGELVSDFSSEKMTSLKKVGISLLKKVFQKQLKLKVVLLS